MKTPGEGVVIDVGLRSGDVKEGKQSPDVPASFETAIVACGFGKFHYLLMLSLIPMCCAQLFSSGVVAFILPTAQCDLHLEDYEKGALNAATYLGNLAAGLVWGGLSDMFGRRSIIIACFLMDFVVSFMCSFAHAYWVLLVLKVLTGILLAGPNSVLYAYLAEVHDDKHRSMSIMMNGLGFAFAQIVQPVLAYLLLPLDFRVPIVPGVLELTSWRVFLMVSSVPSIISGLWFMQLPESPKFLMSQGRHEEALQVLHRIYAANTGNAPETYPVKTLDGGDALPAAAKADSGLKRAIHQFSPLFRKPYVTRILAVVLIQVNIMICINSLRLWTPQLFALMEQYERSDWDVIPPASTACQMISAVLEHDHQTVVDNATLSAAETCHVVSGDVYLRSVIIGAVGTVSFIFTGWASRKCSERILMLLSFPLAGVNGLAMLWAANSDVFMAMLATFNPMTAVGLTALSAASVNLFPTSLRGVSMSFSLFSGRVASLSGNLILPILLNISCESLFIFVAVCLGVCTVIAWFFPRKSKDEKI